MRGRKPVTVEHKRCSVYQIKKESPNEGTETVFIFLINIP